MSLTSFRAAPPRVVWYVGLGPRAWGPGLVCVGRVCRAWRRPTLPRLEAQYHWRCGFSRPSSGWDRVFCPSLWPPGRASPPGVRTRRQGSGVPETCFRRLSEASCACVECACVECACVLAERWFRRLRRRLPPWLSAKLPLRLPPRRNASVSTDLILVLIPGPGWFLPLDVGARSRSSD